MGGSRSLELFPSVVPGGAQGFWFAKSPGKLPQVQKCDKLNETSPDSVLWKGFDVTRENSVTTWITQLKEGDEQAAQQLWERYFRRLVQVARTKLGSLPRQVSDEEDVALSAFHSFCQAVEKERFPRLESREDLWQLLLMHTARKVVDQRRYQGRKKRGGEVAQFDVEMQEVIGTEPDPQFVLEVADQLEQLMNQLPETDLRQIAQLKLEGFTNEEIADELDYSESTVRRKTALIRRHWKENLPEIDNS